MEFNQLKRREFIRLLGGAATTWPLAAQAQQTERVRRIGALMGFVENDAEGTLWLSSFKRGLQELGWLDGRNVLMDVRWSASNTELERIFAKELVSLQPDVILAHGTPVTAALRRETQMIPIVFGAVADPVGEGFVESLSRPGGNITGFLFSEAGMGGKWLELLKEIAPSIKRAAMIFNPDTAPGRGSHYLPSFEAAARSLRVEPITEPVHNEAEIETVVTELGHKPESGLVVIGDSFLVSHRRPIILAAAENKVPAVYFHAVFARDGGLLSYGPDNADIFRRAASYVDRILRGASPVELPVQVPIKFETVINLKTAKALDLTVPLTLQVAAAEVIE
jgi:putative tryptophan/tyrosine transport system substrate-binding protein